MSSPALSKPQKTSGVGWQWGSLVGEGMLCPTEKSKWPRPGRLRLKSVNSAPFQHTIWRGRSLLMLLVNKGKGAGSVGLMGRHVLEDLYQEISRSVED